MVTVSSYALQILNRAFPKDSECLSKSYYKILFAGAVNRGLEASMFYCYPTSDLLSLLKIVAKMIHISSFILLLLLCANKSILGNLMKQYVLGESFDDWECRFICLRYWRFLCKTGMDEIKSSPLDRSLSHTYLMSYRCTCCSNSGPGYTFSNYYISFST